MAASTERALRLVALLQSAHTRNVAELVEHLDVDERTVRRDVAQLVKLGVPVESLRGRYGGYRLAAGQRVLPLMLSGEEVVAVALGVSHAQATAGQPSVAVQTALAKVTRAMPVADAERIDAVLRAMTSSAREDVGDPDPGIMLTLAESVSLRRPLDLRYRRSDGTPSRRTVHPYGLVAHERRWYLVAFDTGRGAERTFRVDRISIARAMTGSFVPPDLDDLAAHVVDRLVDADHRWHVVLRIRASEEQIRTHLPPSIARLTRIEGAADAVGSRGEAAPTWHRADIRAQRLDWLPGVIAALDCEVVIDAPEELRAKVREVATRLRVAAEGAGR